MHGGSCFFCAQIPFTRNIRTTTREEQASNGTLAPQQLDRTVRVEGAKECTGIKEQGGRSKTEREGGERNVPHENGAGETQLPSKY